MMLVSLCAETLDILGYVRRASSFGITFQRGTTEGMTLQVFTDEDYASMAAERRSVSGGVMCGGACVSWFSRTQECVTLSTTEAKYVALADVIKKSVFFKAALAFHVD